MSALSIISTIGAISNGGSSLGNISGELQNAGNNLQNAANNLDMANPLSGITGISIGGFVSSTIGQVFANGFDLSCWGASATPAESKEVLPLRIQYVATKSGINNEVSETTLNSLSNYISGMVQVSRNIQAKGSSCTKKAHKLLEDGYLNFFQKVLEDIRSRGVTITENGLKEGYMKVTDMPRWGNGHFYAGTGAPDTYQYMQYKISVPQNSASNNSNSSNNNSGSVDSPDSNISSSSSGFGILGTILVGLFLNSK